MIRKETCAHCKGNRYVEVKSSSPGDKRHIKCPQCNGSGYQVKMTRPAF